MSYNSENSFAAIGNNTLNFRRSAYDFEISFNLKPYGTIIKNHNIDMGHFTPYIQCGFMSRTIYDLHPVSPKSDSETYLSGSIGTQFSITKKLDVFFAALSKYMLDEAGKLSSYNVKHWSLNQSLAFRFGTKIKI